MAAEGAHQLATAHIPQLHGLIALPEASRVPSGLKATEETESVWPLRVRTSSPLRTSHSFTV